MTEKDGMYEFDGCSKPGNAITKSEMKIVKALTDASPFPITTNSLVQPPLNIESAYRRLCTRQSTVKLEQTVPCQTIAWGGAS